jgi:type IV pilus assembly protein PilC
MNRFSYQVKDKNGNFNVGYVEGEDREAVAQKLIDQGLTPIKIMEESSSGSFNFLKFLQIIPASDKVLFAEELATLINAGVPISQSLNILEKQNQNPRFKAALNDLARQVEAGTNLSLAMEKHPDVFSPIFINMIRAGEIGGTLDEALTQLATQLNKDHELSAKIKGAMAYPSVILVAMIGAVIYLMLTIVPQLSDMFKELGGELPASTKSLVFISNALTKYGIITFLIIATFIYTFRKAEKTIIPFRRFMHKLFITLPPLNILIVKMNVAHFARTLSSLLGSGVSVVESLNIVADSTQNLMFKEAIQKTAEKVKNGVNIAEVIKTYKIFPILVAQMISVGEETGSLDTILKKIADFYEREVDDITKNLSTLLEPMMMIMIGIMVGYVIISIITPIYSMTNMF